MNKIIREFFFLHRSDRRALLIIITILCLSFGIKMQIKQKSAPEIIADPEFLKAMAAIQNEIDSIESLNTSKSNSNGIGEEMAEIIPFSFDPNKISIDSMKIMNLPDFLIRNINKYRNSGGHFYRIDDIKKIYGMDTSIYTLLKPFIRIESMPYKSLNYSKMRSDFESISEIEINSADSISLIRISGIGPAFARRIIKYRELLGGYLSMEQLWEVYGMDSLKLNSISRICSIDSTKIRRINLNQASFKQLISHPYLSNYQTLAILQFRDFSDSIKSIEDLYTNQIIEHDSFIRIRPYLCIANPE